MLEILLPLVIIIPFLSALLLPCFRNYPNLREAFSLLFASINLILVIYIYNLFNSGYNITIEFITINSIVNFSIYLERLSLLFALLVSFLWIVSIIYSTGYLRKHNEKNQTRFFAFFAISIGSTLGIAFSSNLLTTFLFYELLTLATFPLVGHNINKDNKSSVATYLRVLITTSLIFFLPAILLVLLYTDSLSYTQGGIFFTKNHNIFIVLTILFLFILGIAKTGIMPVHKWLPSAMVAPTPVSALLHAVAVVKSGVFIITKIIVFIFGPIYLESIFYYTFSFNWLVILPSITILVASCIALFQDNLKKRLAYSTISQLSYIILGLLMLNELALLGSMTHIFAHAFGKITLFFAAGSIIVLSHKTKVSELSGIGKKMPITMIAFTIGALSMVGFPITFGFYSKWFLIRGAIEEYNYLVLFVIIISTILNALYFLPIVFKAFFEEEKDKNHHYEKSRHMDIALIITSSLVILAMIYSSEFVNLLIKP